MNHGGCAAKADACCNAQWQCLARLDQVDKGAVQEVLDEFPDDRVNQHPQTSAFTQDQRRFIYFAA